MGKGHFKTMELSEDAKVIVHSGFLADRTLDQIVTAVHEATGERIPRSTLANYRKWWRSEKRAALEAQAYVKELMAALRNHPTPEVNAVIEQKLQQLYLLKTRDLEGQDPLAVADLALKQQKLALDRQQIELQRERVRLLEQRVKAMEEAAGRARKAVERAEKTLGPEAVKEIKERVYGIAG
jgi:hypothetical protein